MFIRKKDSFIKYGYASWTALFHFNFQGESRDEEIFNGYSNLFAFNDDEFGNDFEFPPHGHKAFLVGTYVIEGKLEHKDSTSNEATVINAGDLQFTDTSKGIWHSETPVTEKVRSLQIWFLPKEISKKPSYKTFRKSDYKEDGKFFVDQNDLNANVKIAVLKTKEDISIGEKDRNTYIYVIEGSLDFENNHVLKQEVLVLENEIIKIKNNKEVKLLILSLE